MPGAVGEWVGVPAAREGEGEPLAEAVALCVALVEGLRLAGGEGVAATEAEGAGEAEAQDDERADGVGRGDRVLPPASDSVPPLLCVARAADCDTLGE